MTLKELKERIDLHIEMNPRWESLTVCIPNNKGGMGGTPVTQVESVHGGIDWDASKFFIIPAAKMIEMDSPPVINKFTEQDYENWKNRKP